MPWLNHMQVRNLHPREHQFYLILGLCLLLIQFALYFADHDIQFYWSDSRYYMFSILDEKIPRSRPVFYGFVIWLLTDVTSNLAAIVVFQILVFCATCMLFAIILRRHFSKSHIVVFAVTLIASLLPVHMIWTRYVMTETIFLLLLTLFVLVSLEFIKSERISALVLAHVVGGIAIGFRWTIVPAAICIPIALPILKWLHESLNGSENPTPGRSHRTIWTGRKAMLFFALSLALSTVVHTTYQYTNSRIVIGNFDRPAYSYRNGLFLLGFLSPIVKKVDIPHYVDADFLWDAVKIDWADRHRRERHRWDGRGIVRQLQYYVLNHPDLDRSANEVAQEIGINALLREPSAFVRLGYLTLTDFWNEPLFESHIRHDLVIRWGANFPQQDFIDKVQQIFGYDVTRQQNNVTPLKSYFLVLQDYITLISLSFLIVPFVLALHERRTWVYFSIVSLLLAFFGASSIALTSWPNARYMQAVSWLCVLVVASFSPEWSRVRVLTSRLVHIKELFVPPMGHRS